MIKIVSFQEALAEASNYEKRHLLLGNGFSIACNPNIFVYGSLYEQAKSNDFFSIPEASQLFEALQTKDFEIIIQTLENSAKAVIVFDPASQLLAKKMRDQANALKTALVSAIADNHPAKPTDIEERKFLACRKFLNHFVGKEQKGKVYTLNYDLLLYWALLHDDQTLEGSLELNFNDGFGLSSENYITWQEFKAHNQRIYYLHGAIHLFDSGNELEKYTWSNTGISLLEQSRGTMEKNKFPLFVAEGTSEQKLTKIKHSPYLYHSFKSFSSQMKQEKQALFVFGHSFSENDNHIFKKIYDGKVAHIFVSIFRSPNTEENRKVIQRAQTLVRMRDKSPSLDLTFYDAESANVWG